MKTHHSFILHRSSFILHHSSFTRFAPLGLVLLAAWLRLWRLDSVPPGLWFDEAYNGMDAVWISETKSWPVFLLGNNGREAMFHYLLGLSITVFGQTAYAIRLVSALLGILSIPVMYRWVLTIFDDEPKAQWLALISTTGLVTSFWVLVMNRAGYRANLLPLFILVMSYFFWYGWQTGKIRYYLLAGTGLGLAQYTYLSARLLPLVFLLFISVQTLLSWRKDQARLKTAWFGLLIMGGVSVLIFIPLLVFFVKTPQAFWGRVGDVAVKVGWSAADLKGLAFHLWEAIRVFIDGQDLNWRHHLLGRPGFDWFNTLGFWLGLLFTIRYYRRPANIFLLALLVIMWLPAPLSEPAFHTLRLSGILPAYYVLMAVGLISLADWLNTKSRGFLRRKAVSSTESRSDFASSTSPPLRFSETGLAALIALLLFSGGLTFYDYFYRWANNSDVYQSFDGPVVDLAAYLTTLESAGQMPAINLIIPFYLYTHASMRYMLHDNFQEEVLLPEAVAAHLRRQEKVAVVVPEYPGDDGQPPAFVWLSQDGGELGTAYVSAVRRDMSLDRLAAKPVGLIEGSRANVIARQYNVGPQDLLPLFPGQMPRKKMAVEWADNLLLSGYEFVPTTVEVGHESNLYLAWKILGYTGLKERMFLQVLDSQGNPVGQQEIAPISRKMYRWRDDGLILEQHPLKLDPDLSTGLYFVRLGFFKPETGQRLPVRSFDQQPLGDEVIIGPLYVRSDTVDPITPQYPKQAMLGDTIELLGYSLYPAEDGTSVDVTLYWQTRAAVNRDYTAFIQLLNPQNEMMAQRDRQPLNGLYPTSRWQPGDIISDRFVLAVSGNELSGGNKLVTGLYDLTSGVRLPAYNHQGQLLPDGMISLID